MTIEQVGQTILFSGGAGSGGGTANAAGSQGEVQYKDGTGLGASAQFYWDTATDRLGLTTKSPSGTLSLDDSSYLDIDTSGHMTFVDIHNNPLRLVELSCPPYVYLKSGLTSEGDISLSASTWAVSKALIKSIQVVTSSVDWSLYILQNGNGHVANDANIPEIQLNNHGNGNEIIYADMPYEDEDATDNVHLYWLDASGANQAQFIITGYKLR
jgi:hypothetical protein